MDKTFITQNLRPYSGYKVIHAYEHESQRVINRAHTVVEVHAAEKLEMVRIDSDAPAGMVYLHFDYGCYSADDDKLATRTVTFHLPPHAADELAEALAIATGNAPKIKK